MRTTIILILVVVAGLAGLGGLAAGCGSPSEGSGQGRRTTVVAGFYPLAFAAQAIGGDQVDVTNLTPAGAEPHDLEVSPRQVQDVRSADLVLLLGHGFQPQLEDASGSSPRVLRLLDVPGLKRFPNDDPHVWLDPTRYALIAERIGGAWIGILPKKGRTDATVSTIRFVLRLSKLDAAYRRGLAHCARHEILTSHEAFAYLARRYGLRQIAITGLTPEAEPTPGALSRVVSAVRKTHATTVFFEPLVSPRIAETVARETGTRTAVLDPIEGLTPTEEKRGANYFSLMRSNLAALRKALACR
jgi:zinc transport system substrate-binding protein